MTMKRRAPILRASSAEVEIGFGSSRAGCCRLNPTPWARWQVTRLPCRRSVGRVVTTGRRTWWLRRLHSTRELRLPRRLPEACLKWLSAVPSNTCAERRRSAPVAALPVRPAPGGPKIPQEIGAALFPDLQEADRRVATEGLLTALCKGRTGEGRPVLPIRAHLFFRNLQGLWVCSNPNCNAAPHRVAPCPVGGLHYSPALTCLCGARILELLYCEACGEVFLGGYRQQGANPNEWHLSPDHPDLEASPDLVSLERKYARYAVFWSVLGGAVPLRPTWTQDAVARRWVSSYLAPEEGRVAHGRH